MLCTCYTLYFSMYNVQCSAVQCTVYIVGWTRLTPLHQLIITQTRITGRICHTGLRADFSQDKAEWLLCDKIYISQTGKLGFLQGWTSLNKNPSWSWSFLALNIFSELELELFSSKFFWGARAGAFRLQFFWGSRSWSFSDPLYFVRARARAFKLFIVF